MAAFTIWCNVERIVVGRFLAMVASVPHPDRPGADVDLRYSFHTSQADAVSWCKAAAQQMQLEIDVRGDTVHRIEMMG